MTEKDFLEKTSSKKARVSKMYLEEDAKILEELAFYSNRFNLDFETMEHMPALKDHIRPFSRKPTSPIDKEK